MSNMYNRWSSGQMVIYPGEGGPGDEWFVSSADGTAGNSAKDWEHAEATIDAAVGLAAVGDTIWVAPDHAESITADSGIDIDVAGIAVRGVVRGRQMPTITFTTSVAADCKLAAAGVTIQGLRFIGGYDALTGCIEVSAADCAIIDCEYRDSTGQAVDVIITTAAAERLLIDGFRSIGALGTGANSAIAIVGAIDGLIVRNCYLVGDFAVTAIDFRSVASTNVWIHDVCIWNDHATGTGIEDTITASTGIIGPNIQIVLETDGANVTEAVTGATFHLIDPVYIVNAVDQKALLINWTPTGDA